MLGVYANEHPSDASDEIFAIFRRNMFIGITFRF